MQRAEELKDQLCQELEQVHELNDVFDRQERLRVLFDQLARLAIEASRGEKTGGATISPSASRSSRKLAREFVRVLQIPGAQAVLERCQVEGLERIDAYESKQRLS